VRAWVDLARLKRSPREPQMLAAADQRNPSYLTYGVPRVNGIVQCETASLLRHLDFSRARLPAIEIWVSRSYRKKGGLYGHLAMIVHHAVTGAVSGPPLAGLARHDRSKPAVVRAWRVGSHLSLPSSGRSGETIGAMLLRGFAGRAR
jgi:hypothetical protein